LLSGWVFESLPVDRIEIHAEPGNAASRRVAERAGFTFEGVLRSYFVNKGVRRDAASYSLLRGELR
jgi:RimJ/RimL family protein N-acetyltransferase